MVNPNFTPQEAYEAAFDASPFPMALCSPDGKIIKLSRSLEAMVGERRDLLWNLLSKDNKRFQLRGAFGTASSQAEPITWRGEMPGHGKLMEWSLVRVAGDLLLCTGQDVGKLVDLEAALKRSEQQFRSFMDGLPGIAFIKDGTRRLRFMSKRFEEVFECSTTEGLGRRDEDFLPRAVARRTKQIESRILKHGGSEVSIEEDEAVPGGKKWMIHRFALGEGSHRILAGLSLDITELSVAEDRFRAAAQANTDAVAILRPERDERGHVYDLTWEFLNDPAIALFHLDSVDVIGTKFSALNTHGWAPNVLDQLIRVVETGIPLQLDIEEQDRSYRLRGVRAGDVIALGIEDRTAEVEAISALESVSKRYERLFDSHPAACMTLDLEGRVVDWNFRSTEVYGYSKEEAKGKVVIDLVVGERSRSAASEFAQNTIEQGGVHGGSEWQVFHKDGTPIWVLSSSVPLHDANGVMIGRISSNIDITARKKAEAALRSSNADLEQFAYVASHDLLEPLRMISCYVDLIDKEYSHLLDEPGRQFLHFALDGSNRMREMIKNLLEFSRVGSSELTVKSVDMNEVCREVLLNMHLTLSELQQVQVSTQNLPQVLGSHPELVRLIQNLVANSLKFRGPAPLNIVISASGDGSMVEFSVRDNGTGIDPRFAAKVFNLFQRLHHRTEYPGHGIGLAVCKKIVERHGGEIRVNTEATEGCDMRFTLPIDREAA